MKRRAVFDGDGAVRVSEGDGGGNGHVPAGRPLRVPGWSLSVPKVLTMLADVTAFVVTMAVAYALRRISPLEPIPLNGARHAVVGALSVPLWTLVFVRYRLYSARQIASRLREFERIVHALIVALFAAAGVSVLLRLEISRGWLLLCLPVGVAVIVAERELVRRAFLALRRRGRLLRRVVVIGTNMEARYLGVMLRKNPAFGCAVAGFVGPEPDVGPLPAAAPWLGPIEDLAPILDVVGATGVLIATTAVDYETSNRLTRQLTDAGIHVELSSSLRDIRPERLTVSLLGSAPMIYVEPVRRGGWRGLAKRAFDTTLAVTVLVLLAPVLALVALAVRLDSPGPVLFRQQRVGQGGGPFSMLKFRTMVVDAELLLGQLADRNEADGPLFKIRRDPRVTRVGRVLRPLCLDELPQLWNVLRGEMSLVGPRPALPSELHGWSPTLHQRLRVKPGMTGMWQVSGRSDAPFEDYSRLDLYYVDNWSLWTDLAIIAKTIPTLLLRRGGY